MSRDLSTWLPPSSASTTSTSTPPSTPTPASSPALDDLLKLDAQFCFPIYAAAHLVTRAYRPLLAPLGLTYPQYLVMLVLWEHDAITVKDLGARLHLDSGTLSPLLTRLGARRLLKKARHKDDARRVTVTLTAKGRALRADAERVPAALVCQLLGSAAANDVAVSDAAARFGALKRELVHMLAVYGAAETDPVEPDPAEHVPADPEPEPTPRPRARRSKR